MIYIDEETSPLKLEESFKDVLYQLLDYALREEEIRTDYELSMVLVDNEEIHKLNYEYRKVDSVTDVLSFPLIDYPPHKVFKQYCDIEKLPEEYFDEGRLLLGDIVLSLERAGEQALEYGHSLLREVCYLVLHSLLHLLGYDHMEEEDKIIMRAREEEILAHFDINRY